MNSKDNLSGDKANFTTFSSTLDIKNVETKEYDSSILESKKLQSSVEIVNEPEENSSTSEYDFKNRELCSDGNCIGVIGPDGFCKECGKSKNDDSYAIKEGSKHEHSFKVKILNEALSHGEKLWRLVSFKGSSTFRNALLEINTKKIILGCTDHGGTLHILKSIKLNELRRILFKRSAFTPAQQLARPAFYGMFCGFAFVFVIWLRIWLRYGGHNVNTTKLLGWSFIMVLVWTVLCILLNLHKVVWSDFAEAILDSTDGKSVLVAIENYKVDNLISIFKDLNIPVEYAYSSVNQSKSENYSSGAWSESSNNPNYHSGSELADKEIYERGFCPECGAKISSEQERCSECDCLLISYG